MVELSDRLGSSVVVAVPSDVASFPHRDLQENNKPKKELPIFIHFCTMFPVLPHRARNLSRTDSRQPPLRARQEGGMYSTAWVSGRICILL
jgi:hypothetical protein